MNPHTSRRPSLLGRGLLLGFVALLALPLAGLRAGGANDANSVPQFRRSDANDDGVIDISDAVSILLYLFAGGGDPGCKDAADANDDGVIDLSDSIRVLRALFSGASPPPPPFEACGVDPTGDDSLACAEYRSCPPIGTETDFAELVIELITERTSDTADPVPVADRNFSFREDPDVFAALFGTGK